MGWQMFLVFPKMHFNALANGLKLLLSLPLDWCLCVCRCMDIFGSSIRILGVFGLVGKCFFLVKITIRPKSSHTWSLTIRVPPRTSILLLPSTFGIWFLSTKTKCKPTMTTLLRPKFVATRMKVSSDWLWLLVFGSLDWPHKL